MEENVVITDLKLNNTLFDVKESKGYIIDGGGYLKAS